MDTFLGTFVLSNFKTRIRESSTKALKVAENDELDIFLGTLDELFDAEMVVKVRVDQRPGHESIPELEIVNKSIRK